jgi:iron complex outermembrane receptor protein
MKNLRYLKSALVGGASVVALVHPAAAKLFDIPDGDLTTALVAYMKQSNVEIVYADDVVRGHKSRGAKGDYTETAALTQLLRGTGFMAQAMPSSNAIGIVPQKPAPVERLAQAARRAPVAPMPAAPAAVETVVVTAQHKKEDIQQVPIAVTALSQKDLTDRQIAGGPDLLRDVPNMNFGKTNFSGYNLEIRGIGTQAISVTTDPAVAVAFNDIPFIRNHFFEQEFYDLADAEVLRGPQGTLYGRNATAGVVNIKSALPTDSYEAMLSADIGNYSNRRLEGMLNIPIVGDQLDIRIAGEWTKRDGYSFNTITDQPIDGRDLWSSRVTIGWKPTSDIQAYLIWEHFSEDDDRLRSGKQLCETAPIPAEIGGVGVSGLQAPLAYAAGIYLSQGCEPTSLYSPNAFEVPNGYTLPYYEPLGFSYVPITAGTVPFNPYASTTQSTNLRDIESTINPTYRAKNDTLEFNVNYSISPALTLTSQTGYNHDYLWSTEDYNRFDTEPGAFNYGGQSNPDGYNLQTLLPDPNPAAPPGSGVFCDPQLGCSDRLVAEDLDVEHAWQFSQEFRLASNFSGPFNFSVGGNYLHYETEENYYVFINSLTLAGYAGDHDTGNQTLPWVPGVSDNSNCLQYGYAAPNLKHSSLGTEGSLPCFYIDPNPIGSLNNEGHNYFLSQNPYVLNSYAVFGETYYNLTGNLKLTGGIRWTDDQKNFVDIPSELLTAGYGYPVSGAVNQSWQRFTGRTVLDWTPQLDFTDQTLVYASYAHGYKAGGANPPGAELLQFGDVGVSTPIHPLTFKPEYIEAFELGAKNTLLDNTLTLNGDIFYYNYTGYQISEIVDRTAINNNYNAHVEGAEVEANWEPLPGLKFNFAGGWEDTAAAGGDSGIDLMDRTAGNPGWIVVKPFVSQASNCILPVYAVAADLAMYPNAGSGPGPNPVFDMCSKAYQYGLDPVTGAPYTANPTMICFDPSGTVGTVCNAYAPIGISGYPGFNPATSPNNGEGFSKNLSGHALPNAPPFTVSLGGEYSMPVSQDWVATLRGDFYYQADSWARIFNDNPYDRLEGYTNVNVALILTSANGWQVMGYVKNVFNVTAITGDFLNSDDSGLTTNVFLTDPRLFGVRVTKQLDQGDGFWGSDYSGYDFFTNLFSDTDNGKPPLWIEVGGDFEQTYADHQLFNPPFLSSIPSGYGSQLSPQEAPKLGLNWEGKITFEPDNSDWVFSVSARYGRASQDRHLHEQTNITNHYHVGSTTVTRRPEPRYADAQIGDSESHAILDFMAGKNVGLGALGLPADSVLSAGARYAAFASNSNSSINTTPDDAIRTTGPKYKYHNYAGSSDARRSFHGLGPAMDWTGSMPVLGNEQEGQFTFDWGTNGAVLFGRQKATGIHKTGGIYYCSVTRFQTIFGNRPGVCPVPTPAALSRLADKKQINQISHYQRTKSFNRSRMVTVPNLGGFVGVSMKYNNAKVSFGYRADEFFGAMDGGIDAYKAENRGFFGPFANISIGIGG